MKSISYKILIFSAVLFFLAYYFRAAFPYIEYEINKKYIIENLCQNQDKPWMNCQGKCHLKKQIKKAQKEEKKQKPFIISENTLLFFTSFIETEEIIYSGNSYTNTKATHIYSYIFVSELLKPPQFIFLKYRYFNINI